MPQSELIAMLFKTCKFNMQSEGICHYDLIANATSKPAYEDMIVGSVTPQMVNFGNNITLITRPKIKLKKFNYPLPPHLKIT